MSENIVLVDVGSANGLYTPFKKIRKNEKNVIIYTFDPEKTGFQNNIDKDNINFNLGLYNDKVLGKLYITKKKECSSLFEPNMELMSKYENPQRFKVVEIIDVELERLDSIVKKNVDIIKLDTQGSEYEILEGCGNLLTDVKIIVIEVEFDKIYLDQKLFMDLYYFLKNKNFKLIKFLRLVYFSTDKSYEYSSKIEEEIKKICKSSNLDDLGNLYNVKFLITRSLLKNNINNIQNFYKLIELEKEIKNKIPDFLKNRYPKLFNCDLLFGDAVFVNQNNEYNMLLNYIN